MRDLINSIVLATEGRVEITSLGRLRQLAGLTEGLLIPMPNLSLRIAGGSLDFYQLLKMTANPNLAHKVSFVPTSRDVGRNITDVLMIFYDQISYDETKRLFDYYDIPYREEMENDNKHSRYRSDLTPPEDTDEHFS